MIPRVTPGFKKELVSYGLKDWNDCFHCGNCTALCPLTRDDNLFPRKGIRLARVPHIGRFAIMAAGQK